MWNKIITNMVAFFAIIAFFAILSFVLGRKSVKQPENVIERDTVEVVRIDTAFVETPIPIYKEVIRTEYLAVTDTVRINDTTYLPVPIERKVYEDSLYRAVISGYHPNLDSLWVFNTTHYVTVTNTVKEKRSHFGVSATFGPSVLVTPHGDVVGGLGATAGISYSF